MRNCARPAQTTARFSRSRSCRAVRLAIAALVLAGSGFLAAPAAEAKCVRSGVIYTCLTPSGPPIMLSCYGAGGVQTCIDFSGKTILVGHHWRNELTITSVQDVSAVATTDTPGQTASSDQIDTGSSTTVTTSSETDFETELATALAANAAAKSKTASSSTRTKQKPTH
jgi:hypothetical protein